MCYFSVNGKSKIQGYPSSLRTSLLFPVFFFRRSDVYVFVNRDHLTNYRIMHIYTCTLLFCTTMKLPQDWSAHSWGVYFTSQASPFHVWSFRLQSALGMGFTMWVAQEFKRLLLFSLLLAIVTVQGYRSGGCMEQEWAFVFAVAAWWGIMLVGHAARRKNLFKPPLAAGGSATAVAGRGGGGGNGNDVGNGKRVAARV